MEVDTIISKYNINKVVGFIMIALAISIMFGAIAASCSRSSDKMTITETTDTSEFTTSPTETTTEIETSTSATAATSTVSTNTTTAETTATSMEIIETSRPHTYIATAAPVFTEKKTSNVRVETTTAVSSTAETSAYTTAHQETLITEVTTASTTQTETVQKKHYSEQDILDIARILYSECRGVPSTTEQACVAWTVLNRVDMYGSTVYSVVRQNGAFAFNSSAPVWDSLYTLAEDVLSRWSREKNGEVEVGRVLPSSYIYFAGRNGHNYFRDNYSRPYNVWNYSLPSPYEN